MMARVALWAVTAVIAAQAQAANPKLPLSGFLYDTASKSLRVLTGIPGSAFAGPAVARDLDAVWPSARGSAVGVREGKTFLLTALETLASVEHPLADVPVPDRTVWSPRGNTAALYSSSEGLVQRVNAVPVVSVAPPVYVRFAGAVNAMAVGDTGDIAVAAGEAIYLIRGTEVRELASGLNAAAMAFGPDQVLYAAHSNGITAFSADGANSRPVLEGRPVTGVLVQQRTGRVFGIDAAARRLLVFDGESIAELELERTPSALRMLQDESILLLNGIEEPGLPAIVLDIARDPVLFFIPVGSGDPA